MRTTVTLSKEADELVMHYSNVQGVSKSKAVSELILLGKHPRSRIKLVDGIPVFENQNGGQPFDLEDLKRLAEEDL
jgi:hypothetical protein